MTTDNIITEEAETEELERITYVRRPKAQSGAGTRRIKRNGRDCVQKKFDLNAYTYERMVQVSKATGMSHQSIMDTAIQMHVNHLYNEYIATSKGEDLNIDKETINTIIAEVIKHQRA